MWEIEAGEGSQKIVGEQDYSPNVLDEYSVDSEAEQLVTVVDNPRADGFPIITEDNNDPPEVGLYEESGDIFLLLKYLADPQVIDEIRAIDPLVNEHFIAECIFDCLEVLLEKISNFHPKADLLADKEITHFLAVLYRVRLIQQYMTRRKMLRVAQSEIMWMKTLIRESQVPHIHVLSQQLLDHFQLSPDQVVFTN